MTYRSDRSPAYLSEKSRAGCKDSYRFNSKNTHSVLASCMELWNSVPHAATLRAVVMLTLNNFCLEIGMNHFVSTLTWLSDSWHNKMPSRSRCAAFFCFNAVKKIYSGSSTVQLFLLLSFSSLFSDELGRRSSREVKEAFWIAQGHNYPSQDLKYGFIHDFCSGTKALLKKKKCQFSMVITVSLSNSGFKGWLMTQFLPFF